MNLALQVDTDCTESTHDDVGADSTLRRQVAAWIAQRDILRIVDRRDPDLCECRRRDAHGRRRGVDRLWTCRRRDQGQQQDSDRS